MRTLIPTYKWLMLSSMYAYPHIGGQAWTSQSRGLRQARKQATLEATLEASDFGSSDCWKQRAAASRERGAPEGVQRLSFCVASTNCALSARVILRGGRGPRAGNS